jgi:large subunit ribosomal protein L19
MKRSQYSLYTCSLTGKKRVPEIQKPAINVDRFKLTRLWKVVRERIQSFRGDVLKRQGTGHTVQLLPVRKISDGVGAG